MTRRKIIHIDEALCNGCGQCVTACAEGAIKIIDGKAKLISDKYCDGLGACLGECPQDAIRIIEREADEFDEAAVNHASQANPAHASISKATSMPHSGCPGMAMKSFLPQISPPQNAGNIVFPTSTESQENESASLANWPVQLHLVPPHAPFLKGADILLAADCVPAAMADFHRGFLQSRPLLIGCPKLDDTRAYVEKLAAILRVAAPRSLTVAHMQVPCCLGLMRIATEAITLAESDVPLHETIVSLQGKVLKTTQGK
jgi:Pyruvate/2-oxoacid:ferredoxin oxidoreductase delta subunit